MQPPAAIYRNTFLAYLFILPALLSHAQQGECLSGDCQNGKGVFMSTSQTKYEGNFKNGAIVKGKCTYKSGASFEGPFKDGFANGTGVYIDQSKKTKYTGSVSMGSFDGQGLLAVGFNTSDSVLLTGVWKKGQLNGKAVFRYKKNNATEYTANCITKEAQPAAGPLTVKFADGRIYSGVIGADNHLTGDFSKAGKILPAAKGKKFNSIDDLYAYYLETAGPKTPAVAKNVYTVNFSDHSSYTGEWKDSLRNGTGTYTWANGDKYVGQWKNGLRDGAGIKYDQTGKILQEGTWVKGIFSAARHETFYGNEEEKTFGTSKYTGQLDNGVPNGYGKVKYQNGVEAEGIWKNGMMQGWGVYRFPNGNIYEGTFMNNPEGHGVLVYTNGDYYEGQWKAGKYSGNGYIYKAAQGRYDGEWQLGKKNGTGLYIWPNGERYTGNFKDDLKDGVGVYYDKAGKILFEGSWVKDVFNN